MRKVRQGDNPYTPGGYGEVETCNVCGESIKVPHEAGCTWLPLGYWADADGRWGIHPDPHKPKPENRVLIGQTDDGYESARHHWEEAMFTYKGYRKFTADTFDCDNRRMSFLSPDR